jgi:hypothetical protein
MIFFGCWFGITLITSETLYSISLLQCLPSPEQFCSAPRPARGRIPDLRVGHG